MWEHLAALETAKRELDEANDRYHDLAMAAGIKLYSLPDSHVDIVDRIQELRSLARKLPSAKVIARIRALLPAGPCNDPLCDFESCLLDKKVHAWLQSLDEIDE